MDSPAFFITIPAKVPHHGVSSSLTWTPSAFAPSSLTQPMMIGECFGPTISLTPTCSSAHAIQKAAANGAAGLTGAPSPGAAVALGADHPADGLNMMMPLELF